MKLNKKYKDRLFCLLFGNEEYKENILSLYNALCNTAHTDVNDIKGATTRARRPVLRPGAGRTCATCLRSRGPERWPDGTCCWSMTW